MTIVGVVLTFVLVVCVLTFLKCVAFASSSGRHALGVPRESQTCPVEVLELGDVIRVPVESEIVDQYGVGLSVDDDYPSDFIGARPYLEEYWRKSGRHPAEQTVEFAAFAWVDEDDEYERVSGQLELVA
ncbi:hypothetical protein [Amycolatopsis sp. YIM 10]|uniref:hypothetical protein n=1 Tax=Amycolatopsis sp. YIM 10 TaxID=2653857 RepID=UPI00128FEF5E|nr:hypothetical protein [Amycolatopsis sp. YIM 10]